MTGSTELVVIGGGQAGLAASHELTQLGIEHVVLEKARIGQTWRDRWESFCLVTPNWSVQLPGHPYDGADPDGYMPRDEIVAYLERYAGGFGAPVREGVDVRSLDRLAGGWTRRPARFAPATSSFAPAPTSGLTGRPAHRRSLPRFRRSTSKAIGVLARCRPAPS
jgi:cation diffusion facilitator CzcD-associated flavoprotein CzcO